MKNPLDFHFSKWGQLEWTIAILVTFMTAAFIAAMIQDYRQGECLEHGYPTIIFSGDEEYCVRLEDNTEVVVPLSELND